MSNTRTPAKRAEPKQKSLAEIRQSPHVGLPEVTYKVCLAARLSEKFERLNTEFVDAVEKENATVRRLGAKSEAKRLATEIDAVVAEMAEHTVALRLRAKSPRDWRDYYLAHPAREDNERDRRVGGGWVDLDDLADDVAEFVVAINDAEPTDADLDFVLSNAAPGDIAKLALEVLNLHISRVDLPKSRLDWLATQQKEAASRQPRRGE